MKVDWLYRGIALRAKDGLYIGYTRDHDVLFKYLTINRDMMWWSEFHPGWKEVLVYVGERKSPSGRLLREVLWRGNIYAIRPYDWRNLEILNKEEDSIEFL